MERKRKRLCEAKVRGGGCKKKKDTHADAADFRRIRANRDQLLQVSKHFALRRFTKAVPRAHRWRLGAASPGTFKYRAECSVTQVPGRQQKVLPTPDFRTPYSDRGDSSLGTCAALLHTGASLTCAR